MAINFLTTAAIDGELLFSSNNTGITMKDASGTTTRVFRLNSSNTVYIGPIDSYAGGQIFYGVSADVTSHKFHVGSAAKLTISSSTATFEDSITLPNTTGRAIIIGGDATLDSADASIYLGNAPSSYGFDIKYVGTGSGNTNSLDIVSTNAGSPVTGFRMLQDGSTTFASSATFSSNVNINNDLTVSGGDITLGGISGRIQGVVTVLSGSDATSKTYVDNAIAGVPQGDLTAIVAGSGLTGTSLSGPVPTLNVGSGTGITVNADDIAVTPSQTGITKIYYDGLEIGGVSGVNSIGFSASKIAFTANSVSVGNMYSGGFRPSADNTFALGMNTSRWSSVYATTFLGDLNGTINTATTGVTQSQGNNSTKIATTAYVDSYDSGVQVINEGVGIKKSGSATDVTISVNYDANDTDNLIFGANSISAAVADKPYTPYILAADSNPGQSFGEVKNLRLQSIPLSRFGDATSTIDMGANRILDVADPTSAQDAATKAYVDANSGSGTVTGTGVNTRVAFWSGNSSLTSDGDLTYATATNRLSSGSFLTQNNGDYLGTDTSGAVRTLITLDSNNDVEISNSALSLGSDTNIYYGDNFRIKDGGSTRFQISTNGDVSTAGNEFYSGQINLGEDTKIILDEDGDQWNYVQATSGNMEMGVGGNGLVLQNIEESLYGDITVAQFYNTVSSTTNTSATYIPVYTAASGSTPQLQRQQTPAQFLSNAGAITGAGSSGRLAVWTGSGLTDTIGYDTLYWNTSSNVLGINYSGSTFNNGALQIQGPTTNAGGIGLQIYNSTTGSPYGAHGLYVNGPRYGNAGISVKNPNQGSTFMRFYSNSGSSVGTITQSGSSSTSYGTTSDYRLKENIEPMSGSIERIKALKPCKFNFIEEEANEKGIKIKVDGFIAHEAAGVVPEAVTGQKDETDYKGDPEYQSKLVPLLTSALQEALAKIELLETRLDTLEQKK